jgi:5'-nucleotidase
MSSDNDSPRAILETPIYGYSDGTHHDQHQQQQQQQQSPSNKYKKYKPIFFVTLILFTLFSLFLIIRMEVKKKPFLTIFQMNDVYEISSVAGLGGFSRLATYHNKLKESEEHLISVMAGDFYSPSALGIAPVQLTPESPERPLHGRQMVDVMNHLGSKRDDFFVTFGNHEYDVGEESFYARINESNFTYIATNVKAGTNHEFPSNVVPYYFKTVGAQTIAFVSLSILVESTPGWVQQYTYRESVQMIKDTVQMFREKDMKYDILIGITHQSLSDDSTLVAEVPELDMVMGGHEHENWRINRSMSSRHPIFINKADSNAKTIFVHRFYWDEEKYNKLSPIERKAVTPYGRAAQVEGLLTIESTLVSIDGEIAENQAMATIVQKWTNLGFDAFVRKGLDPGRVMCHLTKFYNALDKITRYTVSPIGGFLSDAFLVIGKQEHIIPRAATHYQKLLSVNNIGSVRVDDYLVVGDLFEYDALRILPFGGQIDIVEMSGKVLATMFRRATALLGTGMWMGYNTDEINCPLSPLAPKVECEWTVYGETIQPDLIYSVVLPDYVVTLDWQSWFESKESFTIKKVLMVDQQHALINHFGRTYPIE